MIKDAIQRNDKVTPSTFNLERLRTAFPEFFDKADAFRFEDFKQAMVNEEVDFSQESFKLDFVGRSYAEYVTGLDTETVIVPDSEHNSGDTNKDSQNVYIVGDNLDALKHLRKSYRNSIKCIYIDPPYNTGKDGFAYNDTFNFTVEQLIEKVGLSEEEAERTVALNGKASHSAWLSFMLPRIKIAAELLTPDGMIFMSIGEEEQANLKNIADSVFGEQNFIASIPKKNSGGSQDSTHIAVIHEYLLVYTKDITKAVFGQAENITDDYKLVEKDTGRNYKTQLLRKWGDNSLRTDRENLYYPITDPEGNDFYPMAEPGIEGCWRWEPPTMQNAIEIGKVEWKKNKDGDWVPYEKLYEDEASKTKLYSSWLDSKALVKDEPTDKLSSLYSRPSPFKYPKGVGYLRTILDIAGVAKGDIVLDFFSGSASTAHAILRQNARLNTDANFILVQLPEVLEKKDNGRKHGFETIDELGRDRIHRAAAKIKEETDADIDYGFKLFRLETPQVADLDSMESFELKDDLLDFTTNYLHSMSSGDTPGKDIVLTTLFNRFHKGLTPEVEYIELDKYSLPVVGENAFIVEEDLGREDVHALVTKLENEELTLSLVIVLHYSVTFPTMNTLKSGLKNMKNSKNPEIVEVF